MKLSIIIPVYNAKEYIEKCIESAYCFPIYPKEILLINDGSTDGSGELCDELKEKYNDISTSIYVYHQKNEGVSVARNVGLEHAIGDWIWFIDADDCAIPAKFDIPESDVIFFSYTIFDTINNTKKIICQDKDLESQKENFLLRHDSFLNQTMWFKRNLIEHSHLRFTKGMKMAEDLELQYKVLLMSQKPVSLDNNIYVYNVNQGSATNNVSSAENIINDTLKMFGHLLVFIENTKITENNWLSMRLERQLKNILYSYTKVRTYNKNKLQLSIRRIITDYKLKDWGFTKTMPIRLAYLSIDLYVFLFNITQKIKNLI